MPLVPAPAPGGLPLLGHAPRMLHRRLAFLESLRELGPAATVRLGRETVTVLSDHRLVRDVLAARAADFGLSSHFRVMKRIIGNGLLATDGPFHRDQRRALLPPLRQSRLPSYAETMSELTERHLAGLADARQPVDTDRMLMALATENATRCLFSSGIGAHQVARVAEAVPVVMAWAGSRGMDPTGLLTRLPGPVSPLNRRFRHSMAALNTVVGDLIAARGDGACGDGACGDGACGDGACGDGACGDLLDAMLCAADSGPGARMSRRQVHDEAMSFLIASTESVSRTLTWALHLLARNPGARRALHAEADAVLAGRTARWDDLPRLTYTRGVLSEALRLYPPGYLISRTAVRDTAVHAEGLGELPLRAGSMVMFSYYALQRDPKLFPEPAAFRPERWTGGPVPPVAGPALRAYLPFGLGPHGCPGESFAWTEMTLVLASLAARWELRPVREGPLCAVAAFSLGFDDARMTALPRVRDAAAPPPSVPSPRAIPVTHPTGK
ncbi:cytochrome P450 [Streptomyces axinellae]|uniref:Cytochrome P450 n=1 Tax=Streptomyces axinellae TaxID=552788 RepID=A0ABP6CFN8_9ACTN